METVGPVLSGGIWGTGYNFGPPQRRYLWRHDSTDRWKMALWIQRRSKMRRMRKIRGEEEEEDISKWLSLLFSPKIANLH